MTASVDSPQGRRRERVAARLRDALVALRADPVAEISVAALARHAGIGRNALYTNHRAVLEDLRALKAERSQAPETDKTSKRDGEKKEVDMRIRLLATENAALLRRALIAETRAKRLEDRNADLVRELRAGHNVTVLPADPDREKIRTPR
jgi:hypothetical protein